MSVSELQHHERQLHDLASEFEALHVRVRDVSYTPGADALRRIGPLLLAAQDLTATALVRLNALHNSTFAAVAGRRSSLERLSSVLVASSLVNNALALALQANPGEGELPSGSRPHDGPAGTARQAEGILLIVGHLDEAASRLERSATACRHLAADIVRDLTGVESCRTH
ncbi:hypothetical protein [Streptomyces sp. ADI98-10]|uniref:hypothetical protein n=1 Tax=Streptomyces sp. ADI98-10 TaxID=1522763 RepID=UPI000F552372|nr:hypothetical protein [Streptomyces sp. ADI98-10]RPK79004.1 hypothetical protein EES46_33100 [Streptomyces sp. ADI98-10]